MSNSSAPEASITRPVFRVTEGRWGIRLRAPSRSQWLCKITEDQRAPLGAQFPNSGPDMLQALRQEAPCSGYTGFLAWVRFGLLFWCADPDT